MDIEFDDEYQEEEAVKDKVKSLRKKLEKCEKDKKEYLAGWQRAKADTINLKKKFEEDKSKAKKTANKELVLNLIPTLENFEMAFKNQVLWESVSLEWRKGVEGIYAGLWDTLSSFGVEKISPEKGDDFSPSLHEAIGVVSPSTDDEEGKVASVNRVGYKFHGELLKPAQVEVYGSDK